MSNLEKLLEQEFSLDPGVIHLNHAGQSPLPRCSIEAGQQLLNELGRWPPGAYARWSAIGDRLRSQLADLIHAPAADVALLQNTGAALSVVAMGLDWRDGDNIVTSDEEFPANLVPWQALQARGVELRRMSLRRSDGSPEDALLSALDARTRLLAVSSVQFTTGLRLDLACLGAACRARDICFCVDAIQSLGAVAQDVQNMNIDVLAAGSQKWMLGPEGVAAFYCHPRWRERLALSQFGWHTRANALEFESPDWVSAPDARRFECGTPNTLGMQVLSASLALLKRVGMDIVESRILERARFLLQSLSGMEGVELLTDARAGRYAGIVTFRSDRTTTEDLHRRLVESGVVCVMRAGGIRFSPHFYTPWEGLERALDCVRGARG